MTTELAEADELLSVVVGHGLPLLDVARFPNLEKFRDRGVSFEDPDELDSEEPMNHQPQSVQRATINLRTLLGEVLSPLGYAVSGVERDGFVELRPSHPRAGCSFFFLERSRVPPHAVAAWARTGVQIVIHVDAEIDTESYNEAAHALGVHAVRLRDLGAFGDERDQIVAQLEAVREVLPPPPAKVEIEKPPADLSLAAVAQYASTPKQDAHFEWATAKILSPLVSSLFRLGSIFRGLPVPDGLLIEGGESAIYDCKSKKEDAYGLAPSDGDQQNRYLRILDRLEKAGKRPRGIVLFTPTVDSQTFESQTQKEFWRAIAEKGRQLMVVPATALRRLHELTETEETAFATYFNKPSFWRALFDQNLDGLRTEGDLSKVLPNRTRATRLLTPEDVELAWVAAISSKSDLAHVVGEALAPTDPASDVREKVRRPAIVRAFYKALRARDATIETISTAMNVSTTTVRYLVLHRELDEATAAEFGPHGVGNLTRLQEQVRGSAGA